MRMSFTDNNLAPERENFPKIKLGQKESARVAIFETPVAAYVHNLRAPKIVDGRVSTVLDKKNNTQVWEYDFVSNPLCLGNPETLAQSGTDPKNCPACQAVKDHGWDVFKPAQRKFAMHVFQYTTNGSSAMPKTFNGEVKIWAFADKKFGELVAIARENDGDLTNVDLLLGPCDNAMFQLFNILPSRKVGWKELGKTEDEFHALVESNKSKDLYYYIGRKMSKEAMQDKVDEIVSKTRQAHGLSGETAADDLAGTDNLDAGLEGLLSNDEPKAKPEAYKAPAASDAPQAANVDDFEDILNQL
jgi:hypothetical protein